jgi:hypothetical protein
MPRADNVAALEFYSGVIIYFEPRIRLPQLKKNGKCEHFWTKKDSLKEKKEMFSPNRISDSTDLATNKTVTFLKH